VVIGQMKAIDARIASFPRSLYLAKDMTPQSMEMLRIIGDLGHEITAWDEEALVHLPADVHFRKRMSPLALECVSHLFAWGDENADLWRRFSEFEQARVHVTGNPRADLWRPEMRAYFESDASELRRQNGDFLLINTNFSLINSNRALFGPAAGPGDEPELGRGGYGMTREFAERMRRYKLAVMESFQRLIPELERAYPGLGIVVRPHPSEVPQAYHQIASTCERVRVASGGNAIPWLMASKAMIHNGCTTGVEASALGVPTLAYGPGAADAGGFGRSFALSNLLSHQCPDFESLRGTLDRILAGESGCADGNGREQLLKEFVTAREGRLASERIVDVLEEIERTGPSLPRPPFVRRLDAWRRANELRFAGPLLKKARKVMSSTPKTAPEMRRVTFQEVLPEQMRERVGKFQRVLGDGVELRIERRARHIYRFTAREASTSRARFGEAAGSGQPDVEAMKSGGNGR